MRAMRLTRVAVVGGIVLVGLLHLSCTDTTGPTLTADIGTYRLVPSSDVANANSICCCRVQGTVSNTSPITVHVSLQFRAAGRDGSDIGTALDYVPDIPPGGSRPYDAPGIFHPCNQVAGVEPDVLVVGLFEPNP
jgi:hypothetical protein